MLLCSSELRLSCDFTFVMPWVLLVIGGDIDIVVVRCLFLTIKMQKVCLFDGNGKHKGGLMYLYYKDTSISKPSKSNIT